MLHTVLIQGILLAYFQLVEWVPLFPWNDLRWGNPQKGLDLALGGAQAVLMVGTRRGSRRALQLGLLFYGVWLGLQLIGWWVPYFAGASPEMQETYARHFGATLKLLPPIGDHPVPDANHLVLQVLLVLTWLSLYRDWRASGGGLRPRQPAGC